jgi:hypothetical protein
VARTADRLSLGNVGISIQDRITPSPPGSLVCFSAGPLSLAVTLISFKHSAFSLFRRIGTRRSRMDRGATRTETEGVEWPSASALTIFFQNVVIWRWYRSVSPHFVYLYLVHMFI